MCSRRTLDDTNINLMGVNGRAFERTSVRENSKRLV